MRKFAVALFSCVAILMIQGCGDKKDNNEGTTSGVAKEGSIKVTQNAVKVENKKSVNKENGGQFYYSYNKQNGKNEDKSEDQNVSYRTTIDAYMHIKSPYERIKISLMINKLSHDFIVHCSACHDDYGNGIIGPSLLGKDGKYIYGKLMEFKSGKRKNIFMKSLISRLDDKRLKAISDEIADFNAKLLKIRNGK
ncbi:MAG: hypothetical protein GXO12_06630 [Epsilonproteobacteria bacterium]|nr:hypothetical protein [Campylobacterota bacterium]